MVVLNLFGNLVIFILLGKNKELKESVEMEDTNAAESEQNQTELREMSILSQNEEAGSADDKVNSAVRKLFVHSQWLSVQSPYFKALFYSGMKETYSKEVVMKIHEHELEAHLVLIEAMYKPNVLKDKDYHLIVQVLILANKYDVPLLIKKCKSVLMATTPSLEMCEYILKETEHLTEMNLVHDMLQTFLVKEFSPIEKTWMSEKFTKLSKAALRLLFKSDDLATQSENTIFVALMKWVRSNIPFYEREKCDLLDVVRFELMSADFLYDIVRQDCSANKMPGFTDYLQKGLAYHSFSKMRRELLEPKPKKRPFVKATDPTFSWVIDDKLEEEKLSKFPGESIFSDVFWYQGYKMFLSLSYSEDLPECSFFLKVLTLKGKACLFVGFRAKSNLFGSWRTIQMTKQLYTAGSRSWGKAKIERKQMGKGFTIDVWVEIF